MPRHDAVKVALAELVFASVAHTLQDLPTAGYDDAHEPLEDVIIEAVPISDLEMLLRVKGSGKGTRYFSIKVQEDRKLGTGSY